MDKANRDATTVVAQSDRCLLHDSMRAEISEILKTVRGVDETLRGKGKEIGLVGQISQLEAHDRILFPESERGQSIMSRMQFVETVTKVCVWIAGIICAFVITAVATQYVILVQKNASNATTGTIQAP